MSEIATPALKMYGRLLACILTDEDASEGDCLLALPKVSFMYGVLSMFI